MADRDGQEGGIRSGDVVGLVLAVDRLALQQEVEGVRGHLVVRHALEQAAIVVLKIASCSMR